MTFAAGTIKVNVKDGQGTKDVVFDNPTKFIVANGTGSKVTVTTYNSLAEMLKAFTGSNVTFVNTAMTVYTTGTKNAACSVVFGYLGSYTSTGSNLFLPKLQFKGLAYQLKIPQHFLFLEDRMEISTHAGDSVLEYAEIDKVYETEDTFYIYITKRQAIIVAKQDFTQGHSGILRKQFEKKLGKKFVRCYRA